MTGAIPVLLKCVHAVHRDIFAVLPYLPVPCTLSQCHSVDTLPPYPVMQATTADATDTASIT
jgi:hypothetical protein